MIEDSSIIVAVKEQRYSQLEKEIVILDLKSEEYYGLNHVGATIWHSIQEPTNLSKIQEVVMAKYKVEPEQCNQDIKAFLEELETEGLIDVKNEVPV